MTPYEAHLVFLNAQGLYIFDDTARRSDGASGYASPTLTTLLAYSEIRGAKLHTSQISTDLNL